jgi:hypothetical protein
LNDTKFINEQQQVAIDQMVPMAQQHLSF